MDPASGSALGGLDLATAVADMTGDEASSFISRWSGHVDWATIRTRVELPDGARLSFDKRRRSVSIELAEGGVRVIDCGAPGDYLALAAYDRETGGQVALVVDLRRPPVRDGAIVDPPTG